MRRHDMGKLLKYLSLFSTLLLAMILFGCEGDKGDNGISVGTVTGQVADTAIVPHKLAAITVTPSPAVNGVAPATTDSNGAYTLTLPNGNYTLTYAKAGYASQTQTASVVAGQTTPLPTIALVQTAAAVVNVANSNFVNGSSTLSATALVNDPALQGQPATFTWTDAAGNVVGNGPSVTVTQPPASAFKAAVAVQAQVRESIYPPGVNPIADENDFDVPNFVTLDRFQVLPIAQQAFENAALTNFRVKATIALQNFSSSSNVSVPTNALPFVPNGGLRNVPIGQPVVLQGRVQGTNSPGDYAWSIDASGAAGSAVTTLSDPTTRFPHFIPDVPGTYVITENKTGTVNTITIYAGSYIGILTPAPGDNPLGVMDGSCANNGVGCHPGNPTFTTPYNGGAQFFSTTAINTVFSDWQKSGHSMIMVKGMSEGASYSLTSCAKCHSVGYAQYSSAVKAGGFKEVAQAFGFTNATFLNNAPTFFKGFDQVLRLSEVQCETCHGPNGVAHATGVADTIASRFSVAADVCGVCHGEPLRHGRFQEWRGSGHGDFQTAMNEAVTGVAVATPVGTGPNNGCAGCHSGQGFPLLLAQLQGTNGNVASSSRTLNVANTASLGFLRTNNVQPQTCAVCHPVHNPGTEPGLVGDIVILRGDYQSGGAFDGTTPLLPGGFQASGVGKGALCITCHNSRNGERVSGAGNATLHEDGDPNFGLTLNAATTGTIPLITAYTAPHEACQGDVLMGHNAYFFSGPEDTTPNFVKVPQMGQRSRHSLLADACVTCHLQKTPTDPNFGYPPGVPGAGTNHTFNIVTNENVPASAQINALCNQCHGSGFNGTGVQSSFDVLYKQMLIAAGNAVLRIKFGSAAAIPAGTNLVFIPGRTPQVSISGAVPINLATYLASAPGDTESINGVVTNITGAIPANGFQRDLFKANWNMNLVAPEYNAAQLNGSSYSDGTPILNASGGTVGVVGDQSKAVHNPSFVFNVMNVTIARLNAL